jgi:ABC-2 type transport system ATP-binding protein
LAVHGDGHIVVDGLTKQFGGIRAVDNLSFTVEPGSVTGFLGPNGAGKTTTLRVLLGLVLPTAGTATMGGRRYVDLRNPLQTVGAVLEASSFHPGRTGRNHLAACCAAAGFPVARADETLAMVGLTDASDRKVKGYSLGMRQRLALAAALLGDPGVLILEEPANGLDPEGIAWLRRILRRLADQGRTVLVSSHVLTEMQQVADRVVIVAHGRLVRQGTVEELVSGHGEAVAVVSPDIDKLAHALASSGGRFHRTGPNELWVTNLDAPTVGGCALRAGVELHGLRTERSDLEQIFFQLTRDASMAAAQPPPAPVPAAPPAPPAPAVMPPSMPASGPPPPPPSSPPAPPGSGGWR